MTYGNEEKTKSMAMWLRSYDCVVLLNYAAEFQFIL